MITATARAARTAAAFSIIGREGTTISDRGVSLKDGVPLDLNTQTRVTMLAMILLDCFGYEDVERDAILKLNTNRLYKKNFQWLRRHLKHGAMAGVILEFLGLQEEFA
jgi:hypothetical protein